jgi:hypothetical protein
MLKLSKYERSILQAIKNNKFKIMPLSRKLSTNYQAAAMATLSSDLFPRKKENLLLLQRLNATYGMGFSTDEATHAKHAKSYHARRV